MAENCNLGQAIYHKTIDKSGERRREVFFYRGKRGVGRMVLKVYWRRVRVGVVLAVYLLDVAGVVKQAAMC